jgi:hypothetical protein
MFSLAIVGLLAIGLSGLVALALSAPFGKDFVAGDASGVTYTAARCADYFRLVPGETDCNQAAIAHHFGEVVDYRIAAGVLGLLLLSGYLVYQRGRKTRDALPPAIVPAVGASLFGVAACGLLLMSTGSNGQAGAMLSGALVSAAIALYYSLRLSRQLTAWVAAGG